MTSTNLTRTEAAQRADLISKVHYDIALDLTAGADMVHKTFGSRTIVRFTSQAGSTFIDLRAPQIASVQLDGVDITDEAIPTTDNGEYDETQGIQLKNLAEGDHELCVVAEAAYSTTGQGLHRFLDKADNEVYMYTQFETADAKRVFACFDQPDIKATYNVKLTTPAEWSVITNNTVSEQRGVDSEGQTVHTSTVDYQLSTYLVAFCVGPWYEVRDEWTGTVTEHPETTAATTAAALTRGQLITSGEMTVPLALYCRKSLAEYLDADELFEVTKQGFDYYAKHFGIGYPFYKYDQIFCPEYNMGAMENAGCVTIRDEYIFRSAASHYQYERRADTILHELAHMWFGDLVTMKWWDDLWLNESFATWSAAMSQAGATKYKTAWVTFANKEKAWAYGQDQLSSTHPVFSDASDIVTVEANFDGITYAKGASLLKQLAAYVGLEQFFAGIRAHFAAHAWSNATFNDLLDALEQASGRDLSDWADQWLKTTGINTLAPDFDIDANGAYSHVAITQSGAQPGSEETRTHRLAVGVYSVSDSGTVERTARAELDIAGERTEVKELAGVPAGDLVLVNDDDLTYAFIALDNKSLATATENIDKISDPMPRSLIWSAAWQMTRNAQMRARDFVALVARGAASETELAVLEQLLLQAHSAVSNYADPTWAESEGWENLRTALLHGLGSITGQAQLAFVRAYARAQQSAESAQVLRVLLGEQDTVTAGASQEVSAGEIAPGLNIDQDLRWALIIALTGAARITGESNEQVEARITAEQERDSSSTGEMMAIQARAARPDAETKARLWDDFTKRGPELSNLYLRHATAGFTHVGHGGLLEDYGARYADTAPNMWESLSSEMALRTLEAIYPVWDHSESTDSTIAELIESADTPAGLRRVLKEGRDHVARAKAARACDRG
ncbi:aminopeptidase N [Corynebacterium sp. 4HC-13]|uniref:aminopeptidase N n=1 Tax=Corynebacterium anserum TaxID=2684406 RepID=UPI00163A1D69|nr:aminopeptidase N [Corynebacterium anserum]MBC2681066.1 aminopeptidase N [Corynebacterium anserum]